MMGARNNLTLSVGFESLFLIRRGRSRSVSIWQCAWLAAVFLTFGTALSRAGEPTNAPLPSVPFPIGETLHYRIVWGVLPVGSSEAVTEWTEVDGRRLIAIRVRAKSNAVIRKIYPVNSFLETLIDPETLCPVQFTKNSREGKQHMHEVTQFDFAAGVARQHDFRKDKDTEFAIDPEIRDLLSFMYFMRGTLLAKGSQAEYRVMADEKTYDLIVRAVKDEKVEYGDDRKVRALRLEPEASFNGLFVRKGRMVLWVSQEVPTVVLRAEVDVPLARIKLILEPE